MESHLLQMRGLKHKWSNQQEAQHLVASFTDAWIETRKAIFKLTGLLSRIFYRCVD